MMVQQPSTIEVMLPKYISALTDCAGVIFSFLMTSSRSLTSRRVTAFRVRAKFSMYCRYFSIVVTFVLVSVEKLQVKEIAHYIIRTWCGAAICRRDIFTYDWRIKPIDVGSRMHIAMYGIVKCRLCFLQTPTIEGMPLYWQHKIIVQENVKRYRAIAKPHRMCTVKIDSWPLVDYLADRRRVCCSIQPNSRLTLPAIHSQYRIYGEKKIVIHSQTNDCVLPITAVKLASLQCRYDESY